MASFNLGRIKGDKGEKGDTGAKGDRGEKGDKGDVGANGIDGRTPVFTVHETVTISPDEEAYVKLNSDDIENPVLSFYIPRGHDGKDAGGDMLSAVYDSDGKGEDFYKYADSLFEKTLKKEGDTLLGRLTVGEAAGKEASVRNVSMRHTFPQEAVEGDICILTADKNAKTLGECEVGSTMLIDEEGVPEEYIIVAKDYHRKNTVTLIRKYLPGWKTKFNYSGKEGYIMSNIDMMLETTFISRFSSEIRKNLVSASIGGTNVRYCFLLIKNDFEDMDYFKVLENRTATEYLDIDKEDYYIRSNFGDRAYIVTASGEITLIPQTSDKRYRPAIVLPSSLEVENTVKNQNPAVKIPDIKKGIYAFLGGEWKECATL